MTLVKRRGSISIKELHAKTGEKVRLAGKSKKPIEITDRGELVAILASPLFLRSKPRTRTILPEYQAYLRKRRPESSSIIEDLTAMRDER